MASSKFGSGAPVSYKTGKPSRPGFLQGLGNAIVALKVSAKWNGPGQVDGPAPRPHSIPRGARLRSEQADDRTGLRRGNVAGVWTPRPQATCTGSVPSSSCSVPSRSHCRAGLPIEGRGGGAIWHWPSLAGIPPMFCSQCGMSWDAELGSLGRHWCHPLDLIAGQVSSSFQPGTRAGSQPPLLPVPVRLSVAALAAKSRAAGNRGASRGAGVFPAHLQGGPGHASEPILSKHLSSRLPSPSPCSASDPLGPRSRSLFGMMFSGPKGLGEGAERATGPDFCSPEWDRLCTGRGSGGQRYRDVCVYTGGFL